MTFVDVDGARLHVEETGQGTPVLLLHAGVADLRMWEAQMDALAAQGYRAIAYDRRGFGDTVCDPQAPFSHVGDLAALLDALGLEKVLLIGCSQGGRIAIDFALALPQRVSALMLVANAVSGGPPLEMPEALRDLYARLEALDAAGDLEAINRFEARIWLDGPLGEEGRVAGAARELFLDMNGRALAHADCEAEEAPPPAWPRLEELVMPVSIVTGALDWPGPNARNRDMAHRIQNARHFEMAGVAHLLSLEAPEVFNKLMLDFLSQI